jgi:GTP:adenosylcobinamide-phosphate guanylyltransferase
MPKLNKAFTAVVLAADRGPDDPITIAAGVNCKAMIPIRGIPMVIRVLNVLAASRQISQRILCGPPRHVLSLEPELQSFITSREVEWFANQPTPSSSAFQVLASLPEQTPILLTTADHALLSTRIVDYFCTEALVSGCDVVVGIAKYDAVMGAYPQTRRTATRLSDGAYCGCNLFAFLTPQARRAADFWRQVENQRKNPLRVIRALGWTAISRYLLGRLSLEEALERISRRLGFEAGAVVIPFPEAAIDVDSISDWELVEKIVSET